MWSFMNQTKDVFVIKYCFRDSIEEAVVQLHEKIASKDIEVVNGEVEHGAVKRLFFEWLRTRGATLGSAAPRRATRWSS